MTTKEEGVKNTQNFDHLLYGWPLFVIISNIWKNLYATDYCILNRYILWIVVPLQTTIAVEKYSKKGAIHKLRWQACQGGMGISQMSTLLQKLYLVNMSTIWGMLKFEKYCQRSLWIDPNVRQTIYALFSGCLFSTTLKNDFHDAPACRMRQKFDKIARCIFPNLTRKLSNLTTHKNEFNKVWYFSCLKAIFNGGGNGL